MYSVKQTPLSFSLSNWRCDRRNWREFAKNEVKAQNRDFVKKSANYTVEEIKGIKESQVEDRENLEGRQTRVISILQVSSQSKKAKQLAEIRGQRCKNLNDLARVSGKQF